MTYSAKECGCRSVSCRDWHVSDVADVQGVHFTREQAEAVAKTLNGSIWMARYEFQTPSMVEDNVATSTTIHYRAAGEKEAVASAIRWWQNRQQSIPEHFANCCALSVWAFDPSGISDAGYLMLPAIHGKAFEWKSETGVGNGPGVTVGAGLVPNPLADINGVKLLKPFGRQPRCG
jgi:hypothetical protein